MKAIVGSSCVGGSPLMIWMFLYRCSAVCCCAREVETTMAAPRAKMTMKMNDLTILLALSN
jgi:hypothetical protein